MVLGLRSKSRKATLVQVEYLVYLQEVKPWPPLESLKSAESLLLQWENGDHNSGFVICNAGDGKLECSESFRLPVTLKKEASKKGTSREGFQKNFLEFNLYENQKDKTTKGRHIGSAVLNLADYGIIKDTITISCPISLKKSSKSAIQSILYVDIQAYERDNSSLLKEGSLDKDGSESVSEVTNEGNDDGSEIASFTDNDIDDDVSSHSSQNISSFASETIKESTAQSDKIGSGSTDGAISEVNGKPIISSDVAASNLEKDSAAVTFNHLNGTFSTIPSAYGEPNQQKSRNVIAAKVVSSDDNIQVVKNSTEAATSSLHVDSMEDKEDKEKQDDGWNGEAWEVQKHALEGNIRGNLPQDDTRRKVGLRSNTLALNRTTVGVQGGTRRDKLKHLMSVQIHYDSAENDGAISSIDVLEKLRKIDVPVNVHRESTRYALKTRDAKLQTLSSSKAEAHSGIEKFDKEYNNASASAEVGPFSSVADGNARNMVQLMDKPKQIHQTETFVEGGGGQAASESKTKDAFEENTAKLKTKVEMLEEELMEVAAVEVGLYSIVAEHGSSMNKVHAPSRRLSRFYLRACKAMSQVKRANAARAIISGLVLVSKACGNDVPRLTFWLSNAIVLRAIISQAVEKSQVAVEPSIHGNGHGKGLHKSSLRTDDKKGEAKGVDALEEPQTYIAALENVEAWIFSRIVESIWWQTLTPYMQSTAVKGSRKTHASKRYGLGGQEQGNLAIELWKKAFGDACERLCPIRSAGHECGCLPFLPKLVMEQLVVRLDVAMFNAILRESDEEMPTDPVSDPISDLKVLPIPAGRLSFGAGAQLKNAVGSWSRWLTDLFGIDDNEPQEHKNEHDRNKQRSETSFKAFHLLNALSDLMMLPFEMLADRSTRKEVCPTFGAPVIERVLYNFVPDEFNPDPIPDVVYESLDAEEHAGDGEESITTIPWNAAPIMYCPPSAASVSSFIGEVGNQTLERSGSALLRKAYTSDDELDELDSPMTSVIIDKSRNSASPALSSWIQFAKKGRKVVRYQLLREAWKDGET